MVFLKSLSLSALLLAGFAAGIPVGSALAQSSPSVQSGEAGAVTPARLSDLLKIGEVIEVMRLEGLDYGRQMEGELFPGQGGADWRRIVALIYDAPTMRKRFDTVLDTELEGEAETLAAAAAFFDSDAGRRILLLEVEARRSLLDPAVEEAAKLRAEEMEAKGDARYDLLQRFAEANDLIESNVLGALNANLAFFQGMAEVGGVGDELTEDQMLADVWAQEADIRQETVEWLYPYLALSYGSVPDDEMEAYLAFSQSDEGQRLNRALFAAFDAVFTAISRDLGRAAARQMMGMDI
ncbi:DUF2059 domain-containing protein [Szabonella alba]|uniref:DUF2059 domain-containing protein n=1 Tax=Szabonella alba TaxID=2804194 RepID=A0A8K0VGH4_9RHOB|nr:DUF2059 domain-containing protein [Szabonella alba]MBL4918957.1 DUF2059 domain-containing protein [Szabonella alba]